MVNFVSIIEVNLFCHVIEGSTVETVICVRDFFLYLYFWFCSINFFFIIFLKKNENPIAVFCGLKKSK